MQFTGRTTPATASLDDSSALSVRKPPSPGTRLHQRSRERGARCARHFEQSFWQRRVWRGAGGKQRGVAGLNSDWEGYLGNTVPEAATAVYGVEHFGSGFAGRFEGPVHVQGTLTKASGSFKIDHPLDPANKFLSHSFVESPDMKNIYDGNVTTDATGSAIVTLPDYFETLNRDFRYQLTVLGQFAQAIVSREIAREQLRNPHRQAWRQSFVAGHGHSPGCVCERASDRGRGSQAGRGAGYVFISRWIWRG